MAKVTVVGFDYSVPEKDDELPRPIKVTREKLAGLDRASEIPGTDECVDESELDDGGFYHPKP